MKARVREQFTELNSIMNEHLEQASEKLKERSDQKTGEAFDKALSSMQAFLARVTQQDIEFIAPGQYCGPNGLKGLIPDTYKYDTVTVSFVNACKNYDECAWFESSKNLDGCEGMIFHDMKEECSSKGFNSSLLAACDSTARGYFYALSAFNNLEPNAKQEYVHALSPFKYTLGYMHPPYPIPNLFAQFADINGDGKADYCREVPKNHGRLQCIITDVRDIDGPIEKGNNNGIRQFVDINGDKKADYCRETGSADSPVLACVLSTGLGFNNDRPVKMLDSEGRYERGIEPNAWGMPPRQFVDVGGGPDGKPDGKADFCRVVKLPEYRTFEIKCTPFTAASSSQRRDISLGKINEGAEESIKIARFVDVNGDGRADYCRQIPSSNHKIWCRSRLVDNDALVNIEGPKYQDNGDSTYWPPVRHFGDIGSRNADGSIGAADGKADFCYYYYNGPHWPSGVICHLSEGYRFETKSVMVEDTAGPANPGWHPGYIIQLADVGAEGGPGADGKADYCRVESRLINDFTYGMIVCTAFTADRRTEGIGYLQDDLSSTEIKRDSKLSGENLVTDDVEEGL